MAEVQPPPEAQDEYIDEQEEGRQWWPSMKEKWEELDGNEWVGSVLFHILILGVLSLILLPPPTEPPEADLQSRLEDLAEGPVVEEMSVEPLPTQQIQTQEIVAPEAPPMSVAVAEVKTATPASFSPVDMPALDNIAEALSGLNPSGMSMAGAGSSFNSRGKGMKQAMLGSQGGTKQTESAVTAGLTWLVKHQFPDGHWSLDFRSRCSKNDVCTHHGERKADMAATAMAVLPFLAANYTHRSGPYRKQVAGGLGWMVANQRPDGLLAEKGNSSVMYTHGIALIALAEAYALTRDNRLGAATQKAVDFLEKTQNYTGGWRYTPASQDADTSVFGWLAMGLKSAGMAGLKVSPKLMIGCRKYLDTASTGSKGGLFGYTPGTGARPAMTAIGLLCNQYFGARRDDEAIIEGVNYLMKPQNQPRAGAKQHYYWYYATQVIHHFQGPFWDQWNRKMRTIWVSTQHRDSKSHMFGSWEPSGHHAGKAGGRMFSTSMALLTLEIYYRYLPLYKEIGKSDTMTASTN